MTINGQKKEHMMRCLIHTDVKYYKKYAKCVQDERRKINDERKAKEKERKEKEEVQRWSFFDVVKVRKKPKGPKKDAISQPSTVLIANPTC